jgi:hypothetical protein
MAEIVLSEEQAQVISKAHDPVQVRDSSGRVLGVISRAWDADERAVIDEMKRRMKTPHRSYSTEEVLAHLRSLEAK